MSEYSILEYGYDNTDPISIETYAKNLINHSFNDVLKWDAHTVGERITQEGGKGDVGNLIEEHFFHYKANNDSHPDFKEAGVELKVSPYEITNNGNLRAGERLVITMIRNNQPVEYDFYASYLWQKCALILLIYYLRDRSLEDRYAQVMKYVSLFTPPEEDLEIIKQDYRKIIDKIADGRAHELSEADTMYLGACTKGSTALKSLSTQYYSDVPAKRRAFCYKNSYMTYVLNKYIVPGIETYVEITEADTTKDKLESLVSAEEIKHASFESIIESRINKYIGNSDKQLCKIFDREYNNNKAQWNDLVYRMLGIKSNKAEEFVKAQIVVKVIRLEENGTIKESMSLPPFKYRELVHEVWDDSTLHNYFEETRFLFVVFKKCGTEYYLRGCQFWNMPYNDLNVIVKDGWQNIVEIIRQGVKLTVDTSAKGPIVRNNFPGKGDNSIIHIRPHASKRYFLFNDGTQIGDGNKGNANQLPDGTWMPNYSFWINNDYVLSQLNDKLK